MTFFELVLGTSSGSEIAWWARKLKKEIEANLVYQKF